MAPDRGSYAVTCVSSPLAAVAYNTDQSVSATPRGRNADTDPVADDTVMIPSDPDAAPERRNSKRSGASPTSIGGSFAIAGAIEAPASRAVRTRLRIVI